MNILILGGHGTLSKCLIHQLLNKKIKFHVTCYDNNNNNGKTIYDEYQYLEEDCVSFVYGNISDKANIENIIIRNGINLIINNVKYNTNRCYDDNFNILVNAYNSLCELSLNHKIKIINIYRFISCSYYNFKHVKAHVKRQIMEIHNMQKILNKLFDFQDENYIYNITYYDYLYHNQVYVDNIIDKYIKMFMIGNRPYFQNIEHVFNDVNEIISIIFSISLFNENKRYHQLTGDKYSMFHCIAPQLKQILKIHHPKKDFFYHNEEKGMMTLKPIENQLYMSIENTINKI